jgi:uncharacterized protein YodC (DUF2158 family)
MRFNPNNMPEEDLLRYAEALADRWTDDRFEALVNPLVFHGVARRMNARIDRDGQQESILLHMPHSKVTMISDPDCPRDQFQFQAGQPRSDVMNEWKLGDVVKLKSGSRPMTVNCLLGGAEGATQVKCIWFESQKMWPALSSTTLADEIEWTGPHEATFASAALESIALAMPTHPG